MTLTHVFIVLVPAMDEGRYCWCAILSQEPIPKLAIHSKVVQHVLLLTSNQASPHGSPQPRPCDISSWQNSSTVLEQKRHPANTAFRGEASSHKRSSLPSAAI